MNKLRGFSLIELMVVVAIVALLAAIAVPAYDNYVRKTRRGEAMSALMQTANDQEKWFNTNNAYIEEADPFGGNATLSTEGGWYEISVEVDGTTFTATATAQNAQAADVEGGVACNELTLDSRGNRTPLECW